MPRKTRTASGRLNPAGLKDAMKKGRLKSLPVLMYHIISYDTSQTCVPPPAFEAQCRALAENGWSGVGLKEAEEFLVNGTPLPAKSFLLALDDGYLDNYVYAWPIMRKYGHKGVIFPVADKIDEAQRCCAALLPGKNTSRRTIEHVWNGQCTPDELPQVDSRFGTDALGFTVRRDPFFNWDEARRMEQSGEMAIAGHSMRHGAVFTGPRYSGFAQPGNRLRTFTQSRPTSFWGLPCFESGPELAHRAFIPSPALAEAIKKLVPQNDAGAAEFFASPGNVAALKELVAGFGNGLGEFESQEAAAHRMRDIMTRTQATLCRELGHASRSFCWPWGAFCEEARDQGLAAGFEVFFTTREGANRPAFPLAVHRFKVKDKPGLWLLSRLGIYSRPLLADLYVKMRL